MSTKPREQPDVSPCRQGRPKLPKISNESTQLSISSLPAEGVVVLGLVDDAEVLERLLELVNVREAVDRLVAGGVRAVRPPELLRRLGAADSDLGGYLKKITLISMHNMVFCYVA